MGNGIESWSPHHTRVQGGLPDGNFINAQFALVCAGPPFFNMIGFPGAGADDAELGRTLVYPIGLIQNFSIGQNQSISRIFEVGSNRSYTITGRAVGQLNLGRVMYHGNSLLRTLYAYYDTRADTTVGSVKIRPLFEAGGVGSNPFLTDGSNSAKRSAGLHSVRIPPGYDNVFMNLASDLFSQPLGLMIVLKDNEENNVAACYIENCYIPQYGFGFDAQGLIIQEQCSIQYERIQPIRLSQLGLVDQFNIPDETGPNVNQGMV